MRRTWTALFLTLASLLVAAPAARAETTDIDAVTVGALAERADAAVLATVVTTVPRAPGGVSVWTLRVEEGFRGAAKDAVLRVEVPLDAAPPEAGTRWLAFLRRTDAGDWAPLELPWALRSAAEDGAAPLVDYARGYAACLAPDGRVARPEALAAHLAASLGSSASGVPHCAGRDLLRHQDDLRDAFTPALREQVTAALRRPRAKPDLDFAGVVLAAGPFGGPGTDDLLVERLLDPALRTARRHVARSLARRASADLAAKLARRIGGADAAQRADLAFALGRLDRAEAGPPLLRLVGDDAPAVRVEAAHGLGLLARAVRVPAPGADPEAPLPKLTSALDPLLAAVAKAATENERRAAVWAVAQIDTPAAWDALRALGKESPDARVRHLAAESLARPRTSLLLETSGE